MERKGSRKYLIDDEEFEGTLYRGTATHTNVVGDFEGCDFDKLISFDNGLVFECHAYHYHYAYRPKVFESPVKDAEVADRSGEVGAME